MRALIVVFGVLAVLSSVSARAVPRNCSASNHIIANNDIRTFRNYMRCYFAHSNTQVHKESSPAMDDQADADCQAKTVFNRLDWLTRTTTPPLVLSDSSNSATVDYDLIYEYLQCIQIALNIPEDENSVTPVDYRTEAACRTMTGYDYKNHPPSPTPAPIVELQAR